MRKYILLLFIILCGVSNAQIKSGVVSYSVTVTENKDSELEKMMLAMNANYYSIFKEIEFVLKFNKENALFVKTEKMYSDNNAAEMCGGKIDFIGKLLIVKDTLFQESNLGRIGDFIIKKEINKSWVMVNETKLIDNYICYKATTENIVVNGVGTFRHPIIAWYCPQIPFPFGPLGYGSLPGLILELQTKDAVFGVKSIQLNKNDCTIGELKKYKIIEEAELNKLIDKVMSDLQK